MSDTLNLGMSKWKNPTAEAMRFDIHVSPGQRYRVSVPPGATVEIPAQFDDAIHATKPGQNGTRIVVGGLAPKLMKIGEDDVRLDPVFADPPPAPKAPPADAPAKGK